MRYRCGSSVCAAVRREYRVLFGRAVVYRFDGVVVAGGHGVGRLRLPSLLRVEVRIHVRGTDHAASAWMRAGVAAVPAAESPAPGRRPRDDSDSLNR